MDINLPLIEKLAKWVQEGDNGVVICEDCRYAYARPQNICDPCPKAWRVTNGITTYYSKPVHGGTQ